MKQPYKLSLSIVCALFVCIPSISQAEPSYVTKMGEKLAVGTANVVTGIAELPKTIIVTNKEHGPAYAATAGFMTGLVHMVGRTLFGTADLVTFMVPTMPMIYPDYIWKDFYHETSYSFYIRMR